MNTIDAVKTDAARARRDNDAAVKAHEDARQALVELKPTAEMDAGDFHDKRRSAESAVASTRAVVARNGRWLAEAERRAARMSEFATTLAKLDKALAQVAEKDDAITSEAEAFYGRLAGEVAELRTLISAADALWSQLPGDIRADIGTPTDRAQRWGRTTVDFLSRAAAVVYQRLGGFPSATKSGPTTRA